MEISHIKSRAATNNLRLNRAKSKEIIITGRGKRGKLPRFPPPCLGIEGVSTLRVLGVIVKDRLTANYHVDNLLTTSTGLLYALRVLSHHGIPTASLQDVFRARGSPTVHQRGPEGAQRLILRVRRFSSDASDLATASALTVKY